MAVCDQFVVCQAALVLVATRWFFSLVLNLLTNYMGFSSPSEISSASSCSPPPVCSSSNLKMVTDNMTLTTLGNIKPGQVENSDVSCAVCLEKLRKSSQIWELINCNHVFHKHCLEQWVAYDNRLSCPLCRACLLPSTPPPPSPHPEPPSWVVERILYFFGDDLLL